MRDWNWYNAYLQLVINKIVCDRSLMAQWLRQAFRDMKCVAHDLEIMSLNPGQTEYKVNNTCSKMVFD